MAAKDIVFISASRIPSIAANSIQVMKVCQSFAQLGHRVHLLTPADEQTGTLIAPTWQELCQHYGLGDPGSASRFEIEWLPAQAKFRRYDFAWNAVRRAHQLEPDLLYLWQLQAAPLALLWRFPVLLEMHEPPTGRFGPMLFRLFCALPGKKRLLPITNALERMLKQRFAYRGDAFSVIVLPDGVDLERYHNLPEPGAARRRLELPEQFTAGYTGHLYPGRGTGLLLVLARHFPEVHFLWVGGQADDVERWRRRLKEEQVQNVTLTGFVENALLPLYQAAADILLMPYERYIQGSSGGNTADFCSPMKMFEYMACGRAIISSDLPVLREVLSPANAVLCPPEDEAAWKEALASLLSDPQRRHAIARQALQDVQAYSWRLRAQRSLEGF